MGLRILLVLLFTFSVLTLGAQKDPLTTDVAEETEETEETEESTTGEELPELETGEGEPDVPPPPTDFLDWVLPEDTPGTRGAVYRFIRNPHDLTFTTGYSYMSYFSMLGNFYDTSEEEERNDESRQVGHRTDGLHALRLGLQFGRSYLDLRVSPRLGNTRPLTMTDDFYDPPLVTTLAEYDPNEVFLLDARTGLNYEPESEEGVDFKFAMEFYGTYLTFQDPLVLGVKTHSQVLSFGGGYGLVMVGVGIPLFMELHLPLGDSSEEERGLDIRMGLLSRLGVLLPWELAGEIQLLGPDFDLWLSPHWAVYGEVKAFKFQWGVFSHGFNHLEIGFRYKL